MSAMACGESPSIQNRKKQMGWCTLKAFGQYSTEGASVIGKMDVVHSNFEAHMFIDRARSKGR